MPFRDEEPDALRYLWNQHPQPLLHPQPLFVPIPLQPLPQQARSSRIRIRELQPLLPPSLQPQPLFAPSPFLPQHNSRIRMRQQLLPPKRPPF